MGNSTPAELRDLAGTLYELVGRIEATAGDLMPIRMDRDRGLCGMGCGVCPEYGNTLTSSGGQAWCRTCGRRWLTTGPDCPAPEPVTHVLTDAEGRPAALRRARNGLR